MNATEDATVSRMKRSVIIVDDHPITRHGLRSLINQQDDLEVCGEAADADAAMEHIRKLNPEIVLVDISLPRKSGLMLIKDIRSWAPTVCVLALSMHDESLYAERSLHAGANGYIMKDEGGDKLLHAIRHVLDGKTFLSERMSMKALDTFAGRRKQQGHTIGRLTDREFEVFGLLGRGLATREIAECLHLSPKTVDTHRLHIKEKLELRTMPELMSFAVRWAATDESL